MMFVTKLFYGGKEKRGQDEADIMLEPEGGANSNVMVVEQEVSHILMMT